MTLSQEADILIAQAMAYDELTPRLRDQIEAFVRKSPEHARLLAEFSLLDQMLASSEKEADASAVLAMLLNAEEAAEAIIVDLSAQKQTERLQQAQKNEAQTSISFKQVCALAGYLAWQGIRQTRVVAGAVAAVLLMAVTLIYVFGPDASHDTTASDGVASDTQTNAGNSDSPASLAIVATLTAEHDAVWDRRPGQDLYSGQRLTLTHGFAEIMTSDGAFAILQAPTTIQLLDHDNALYLHTGKIVGVCETPSSKGFVVKTNHADITDLGTEFGVAVEVDRIVATVFTGEIEIAAEGGQPQLLTANQRATLQDDSNRRSFVIEDRLAQNFASIREVMGAETFALPGTGQNIAVGQTDPNWRIIAIDGVALPKPVEATVDNPAGYTKRNREGLQFMANAPASSQWITPVPRFDAKRSVTYQTTFDLDAQDLDSLVLELRLIADDRVASIEFNDQSIDVSSLRSTAPVFTTMQTLKIDQGLVTGHNTLTIHTQRYREGADTGFWNGLRSELTLTDRRLRERQSE